ncbi:aquaporin [Candidatus Saccharibacteria bacterium]|nr:aquaporin [Candidatus Saccharibacteria bacterium]
MATTKAKKAKKPSAAKSKPSASKSKASSAAKVKKAELVAAKTTAKKTESKKEEVKVITSKKPNVVREFFSRKFDASENILTIFKSGKIFGALIGEIVGVMLITMVVLTLGLFNPLYLIFAYLGITLLVFRLSGANLNPFITVGMLASRRMSAIRGVLYIIAQILGAWLGFMVVNGFYQAGLNTGMIEASTAALPTLTPASEIATTTEGTSLFWPIVMLEFVGAIIISFVYARALSYKKSAFTFSALVAGGVFLAMLFSVVVCSNFLYVNNNVFVLNPAVAFVYGLFPSSAEGFDALMQALMPMLVTYVVFPVLGGILGFYASDIAGKLSGEDLKA